MDIDVNDPKIKEIVDAAIRREHEGLLKNRDEVLRENKEIKERLAGIDPDRYKRLTEAEETAKAEAERQQRELIESKKDFEGLKQQMQQQLAAKDREIQAAQQKLQSLTDRLHRSIADTHLRDAISAHGGIDRILTPLLRDRVRIKDADDGSSTVEVLDEQGRPMLDKSGNPATVKDLVGSVKADPDYAPVFRSNVKPGIGAHSAPVRSNGVDLDNNPWAKGKENHTQQRYLEVNNPEEAAQFKAAAGVA